MLSLSADSIKPVIQVSNHAANVPMQQVVSTLTSKSSLSCTQAKQIEEELQVVQSMTHKQWIFEVVSGSTSVSYVKVRATKQNNNVQLAIRAFAATATIPKLYTAVEREERSSDRRYILFGPRKRRTWKENVERGVTAAEISMIQKSLQQAIQSHPQYAITL